MFSCHAILCFQNNFFIRAALHENSHFSTSCGMLRFLFHWIGTDYLSAAFRLTSQRRDTKAIVHVYMPRHFMLSKQLFYLCSSFEHFVKNSLLISCNLPNGVIVLHS